MASNYDVHSPPDRMHLKRVGCVMIIVLASSAVGRGFKHWSGQTNDYAICICGISAKHIVLRSKSKDWMVWNQDNVFEWCDMHTCELLFR